MRQLVFLSAMVFIFPALMAFGETVNPLDTPTAVPRAADTIEIQVIRDLDRVNKPVMQQTDVILEDRDDGIFDDAKNSDFDRVNKPVIQKTDVIIEDRDNDAFLDDGEDMDVDRDAAVFQRDNFRDADSALCIR